MLIAKVGNTSFTPGSRMQILAHNAYPDHEKYGDRLDRAIASGVPFVVEEDLAWIDGKSLLIHGTKNVSSSDDPTLDSYFFPKCGPSWKRHCRKTTKNLASDHSTTSNKSSFMTMYRWGARSVFLAQFLSPIPIRERSCRSRKPLTEWFR